MDLGEDLGYTLMEVGALEADGQSRDGSSWGLAQGKYSVNLLDE